MRSAEAKRANRQPFKTLLRHIVEVDEDLELGRADEAEVEHRMSKSVALEVKNTDDRDDRRLE